MAERNTDDLTGENPFGKPGLHCAQQWKVNSKKCLTQRSSTRLRDCALSRSRKVNREEGEGIPVGWENKSNGKKGFSCKAGSSHTEVPGDTKLQPK